MLKLALKKLVDNVSFSHLKNLSMLKSKSLYIQELLGFSHLKNLSMLKSSLLTAMI